MGTARFHGFRELARHSRRLRTPVRQGSGRTRSGPVHGAGGVASGHFNRRLDWGLPAGSPPHADPVSVVHPGRGTLRGHDNRGVCGYLWCGPRRQGACHRRQDADWTDRAVAGWRGQLRRCSQSLHSKRTSSRSGNRAGTGIVQLVTSRSVRLAKPTPTMETQTLIWLDRQLLQFQPRAPLRRQR